MHQTIALQLIVADKLRRPDTPGQFRNRRPSRFLFKPAGLTRTVPLFLNSLVEPRLIKAYPLLATGFADQIHREPIGVVQHEHLGALQFEGAGAGRDRGILGLTDHFVQYREPLIERGDEPLLFAPRRLGYRRSSASNF